MKTRPPTTTTRQSVLHRDLMHITTTGNAGSDSIETDITDPVNFMMEESPKADNMMCAERSSTSVTLTANFITISLLLVVAVAFSIGATARIVLLSSMYAHPILTTCPTSEASPDSATTKEQPSLPSMTFFGDLGYTKLPITTIAKNMSYLDTALVCPMVHLGRRGSCINEAEEVDEEIMMTSVSTHSPSKPWDDYKDSQRLPSGEHLLVDIKDVDSLFLNSEVRITISFVDLIKESKVALLSYHCRSLEPMGVSCFGLSSEGHVSIRTWPAEGVIVVDIFTNGASSRLIPVLPTIKKLFAIAEESGSMSEPRILWSHKLRGFRDGFSGYQRHENALETDVGMDTLRMHYLDMKEVLISEETEFQRVDIYEVINPRTNSLARYERSLSGDGSYESLYPEICRPDKILFLDGVQQSSLYGEAAYHEALVHPSMITHPNPKRVAIVGGGEGATLREVLKHNTVEEVLMVEIDGELVTMCREHLPEWSDCTDLLGSDADSCFEDSRATVSFEDAFGWFIDNFGDGKKKREQFDVIIMDALDPDKFIEIVGSLYKDDQFVKSIFHGLTDEGVFVVQMGEASTHDSSSLEIGPTKDEAHMIAALESAGFESMHGYSEGHSGYYAPWSYLICFKNSKSRASWYETSAGIDIKLRQRLHKTKSRKPSLLFFDAPTMASYQLPSKVDESVYCRKVVTPPECEDNYLNPKILDPMSSLEAHKKGFEITSSKLFNGKVYSPLFERRSRQILAMGFPNSVWASKHRN